MKKAAERRLFFDRLGLLGDRLRKMLVFCGFTCYNNSITYVLTKEFI